MSTSDFDNWEPVEDEAGPLPPLGTPFRAGLSISPSEKANEALNVKSSNSPIRSVSGSHRSSESSIENPALKASPADPELTKVDPVAGLTSLPTRDATALSSVNNIIDLTRENRISGSDTTDDAAAGSFFNSMMSSLSFSGAPHKNAGHSRTASQSSEPNSPSIISYRKTSSARKSKRSISNDADVPTSPLQRAEKPEELLQQEFDKRLYVDEKLSGTSFHFATNARNDEFHSIFKSAPLSDRLLDDFSCALSREFLFQGRLYVSQSDLCFNSNLLGWVTNLVISFRDVTSMEKTSTAGLFPNGISIETHLGKHQFASFISRDTTFNFIKTVWLKFKEKNHNDTSSNEDDIKETTFSGELVISGLNGVSEPDHRDWEKEPPSSRQSFLSANDARIENAILSVDDFTPFSSGSLRHKDYSRNGNDESYDDDADDNDDADEGNASEEDSRDDISSMLDTDENTNKSVSQKVYKLNESSSYQYDGPLSNHETAYPADSLNSAEQILSEVELQAPPGIVFRICFSDHNQSFLVEFLKSQNSSEIPEIGPFKQEENGEKSRKYEYIKGLNYSVGPKSTKCLVTEEIRHCDFEGFVDVVNTTRTPDVPSGNNFSVKTRYMFRWASSNSAMLRISFWVEWSGTSWIKSMIEKSCKSGQTEATDEYIKMLKEAIANNTMESIAQVSSKRSEKLRPNKKLDNASTVVKIAENERGATTAEPSLGDPRRQNISLSTLLILLLLSTNLVLLLALLINQKVLLNEIKQSDVLSLKFPKNPNFHSFLSAAKNLYGKKDSITDPVLTENIKLAEQLDIWDWLEQRSEQRTGDRQVPDTESREQLQEYLNFLIRKWVSGELSSTEREKFLRRLFELKDFFRPSYNGGLDRADNYNVSKIAMALEHLIDV
ncbi:LAMI_0G17348g1_1 [Lachancea mirantina]|uniref:LAMI_0G17348g1_1 n=1 Tax=Lachancea mirantina TaxID=1230905 RepID=A0A1G4KCW8_9SACH|nr:LAMI_0G17348g1_1 [Lachancea mirantina]